jgi:O-antigen/teichoic acid export membrane protein
LSVTREPDNLSNMDSVSGERSTAGPIGPAGRRPSLARNVLSNWVSTTATVVYSLVVTPIVVRALDRELDGIWSFLNGLLAYSGLFYLGLGAAVVRYVAHYHATGNRTALNRLASVVLSIYSTLGLLALGCTLLAAPYVPRLLTQPPAPGSASAAAWTTVLLGGRLLFLFVASLYSGVLVAEGRMDLYNLVGICGTLARFVAVPLVVRTGNPLLALAGVIVITGALETVAYGALASGVDPDLKTVPVLPRRDELRLLYGFGFFAFLLQIAERIISYTDTTVIGVMLGAGSVALYALPLQLAEYARIAINGIVSVLLPHLTALQAHGKHAEFGGAYLRSVRVASFASALLNVNLVFLGVPFLRLWVGDVFADAAPVVLLCLAIASFLQSVATQSQVPFCLTMRTLRFPVLVLLVEALANLVLSIALARSMGIAGVALATAVPALLCSTLFVPAYVARRVGLPLGRVASQALVPSLVLAAALSVLHWGLRLALPSNSYLLLAAKAGASVPVALLVAAALFPAAERDAAVAVARRVGSTMFRRRSIE